MNKRYRPVWLMYALLACITVANWAALPSSSAEADLRVLHASMETQLKASVFHRPIALASEVTPDGLRGDIHAVVDYPFARVVQGLNGPEQWCEVMFLHLNTKYCRASAGRSGKFVTLYVGSKTPQLLSKATRVVFRYELVQVTPTYLEIKLSAAEGPMGVSDVRVAFAAVALANGRTFLRFDYGYAVNPMARLAVGVYLHTIGRGKVGFTVTGRDAQGRPSYIDGMRGLVERNTMRYYLAIDSVLRAATTARDAQMDKRERLWFAAVEEYPLQLHELELAPYLQMKRAEFARQQTPL